MSVSPAFKHLFRLALCPVLLAAFAATPLHAQFWDSLTKPKVNITLTHAPGIGLVIHHVAFGPIATSCAGEVVGHLTPILLQSGVQVMDWPSLQVALARQHISFSGSITQASTLRLGNAIPPTVLIMVNVDSCEQEKHADYTDSKVDDKDVRTYNSTLITHVRGTLQAEELSTGRVFSAFPLDMDPALATHSTEKQPEYPSSADARDDAVVQVAQVASQALLPWTESRSVYFFNDKECNLGDAYKLFKSGDIAGALKLSQNNVEPCKTWPKAKDTNQAHALFNVGIAQLALNQPQAALDTLQQSQQIKGGFMVKEAITAAQDALRISAEYQQAVADSAQFDQQQSAQAPTQPAPPIPGRTAAPTSVEDRLKRLDALYKQGLISKEDYDAKKAEILKDL